MAGAKDAAAPPSERAVQAKKREQDRLSETGFALMTRMWREASHAQLALEQSGEEPTSERIWFEMGHDGEPPSTFLRALEAESYRQLMEIRRRQLVVPVLQDLGVLKDLVGQGAYMALTSVLEDLAIAPARISPGEKRQLLSTFVSVYEKLEAGETGAATIGDAAVDEERRMKDAMARLPEYLRAQAEEWWTEERLKTLADKKVVYLSEANKAVSHAKNR